jgi:hypothetical protein
MKLDIKKIALIMAAGIFAVSGVAFGAGETANVKLDTDKDEMHIQPVLNKLRVNNETDAIVTLKTENEGEKEVTKEVTGKEEVAGNLDKIILVIEEKKEGGKKGYRFGKKLKEKIEAKCKGKGKRNCKQILKDEFKIELDKMKQKLMEGGITVTANEEGDTFVINIKRAGGKEDMTKETQEMAKMKK